VEQSEIEIYTQQA